MHTKSLGFLRSLVTALSLVTILVGAVGPVRVLASHTSNPTSVTIAGLLQSEAGCPGDWDPSCATTHLGYDASDDVWQGAFSLPAGNYEYKAALNNSWDENYGANATLGGDNIALNLGADKSVKFYYDHKSHWVTSSETSVIATVSGSFQSALGCGGDWAPSCLRSWLQDPDGNGIYSFKTMVIPAGNYEAKVTLNESWDVNYGQGGVQNGPNIAFSVLVANSEVTFTYDSISHVLDIQVHAPTTVTLVGSLQEELGCSGDWDPACAATHLDYDANDDVYQHVFDVPSGSYEYKAALNNSWDENYGRNAQRDGANIPLNASGGSIKFYFDPKSHWITDNKNSIIAVAPGSFQSELGCSSDWDAGCLRSWLQDPDENGIYDFTTTAIPAGSYEAKVAINESWDENYGQGGVPGGDNIPFTVPFNGAEVKFTYYSIIHLLTITAPSSIPTDNNVQWGGLRHDSRDLLYRTPAGAVPAGADVLIRFRTFHNDVTGVALRVYDLNANGQHIVKMTPAATDVPCYQTGLENSSCDFWQATLHESAPNNLWYRFIITDGTDTNYYADNTSALDGGLGSTSDNVIDNSYALMFYQPGFTAPAWAKGASIYQIFPDRFRNGRTTNDPRTDDIRYDDPVLSLPWGTLPEGYCRNYADGDTNCPWRFDATPPDWSPTVEGPRGRDYFGGDLVGVTQQLDYLQNLGVTTIYFNPIFASQSNHGYDTANYRQIDPGLGNLKDFKTLVAEADKRGIHIVLDGVFNHMSSDSPFFDRYHHYDDIGACESPSSSWRAWFFFHDVTPGTGTCVDSQGRPDAATYDGWFGFDSIPVLNKSNLGVQNYFLTSPNSISRSWLNQGAGGWRLDVMGDPSFPAGYWETFRGVVKQTKPDALIISETWQKDSTLLRMIRGDRADTTMNYRLRDAVIGLLAPQGFDSKGFGDSGRIIAPSEFAARMESIREDYPDAAYYSLMNLLDSHDTERLRWTLTPGAETTANKELPANVAAGKTRQRLASLIQFTVPGAPTVFYGDEVGINGDDDPDDRRTFPWADKGGTPDQALFTHYQTLNTLRNANSVLVNGDFKILLADDASGVVAYGRKTANQAAVVIINRSNQVRSRAIPVAGYLPDGITLNEAYAVGDGGASSVAVVGGAINGSIGPLSAVILLSGNVDLQPTVEPANLYVTSEGNGTVSLAWDAGSDSVGYNIYRSTVSGGGWVKLNVNPTSNTNFTDTGLRNAQNYYYVVTALDVARNESKPSKEVQALPHLAIGWANLQWPPVMQHTISVLLPSPTAYGQVWIDGATSQPGATETLRAQLGFGPSGSNPNGNNWTWVDASFNVDESNNDEFKANMLPEVTGMFDYVYRYSTTNGRDWLYADLNGPVPNGTTPANPGKLTVNASTDTTAPDVPSGLHVVSASPAGIDLAWNAVGGDASLYGYEVFRSDTSGGPYTMIAHVTSNSFSDPFVAEGATYYYVVRSLDLFFNRSGNSSQVSAKAESRTVTVIFNVTVPTTTDATGLSVHIAGTLSRFDGGYPDWDPGAVSLKQVDATHWTITVTGKESTQIEYKYTLGNWEHGEKDNTCNEIGNRQLTLNYGSTGTQTVNDTVLNWRNVSPCGN